MTKQDKLRYSQRRALQQSGFELEDTRAVRLHRNPKDETLDHVIAKAVTAKVCAEAGYAVDSEVSVGRNSADVVAYGHESRKPIVVELSHRNDKESSESNLQTFQKGPIREVYTLSVEALPLMPERMKDRIKQELGL